jgi:hypothetical protein
MRPAALAKRSLIFLHRWLGVALCVLFLLWFPTGIVLMYWDFPSVSAADRLQHAAPIDGATIRLSPAEAYLRLDESQPPGQTRLTTYDGRPVYRFRTGRAERIVYADTGDEQVEVTPALMQRLASAWTGRPAAAATVEPVTAVDQWTVQGPFRSASPLWRYSWPTGEQVYVSESTGEVEQATTRGSRLAAWFGAIPHWFYFTPLRANGVQWSRVVIWTSGVGTVAALLGMAIGIWMYSPSKRYRYAGAPTSIPYRGQKRWHTLFGLLFGAGAVTWVFSGMLSMDPFPRARTGGDDDAGSRAVASVTRALRGGRTSLSSFEPRDPRQALAALPGAEVKNLEFTSFAGQPIYLATLAGGDTRIIPVGGPPRAAFDDEQIIDLATTAAQPVGLAEVRVLNQYDRYYLDRRRQRPLPVILARINDSQETRLYIDPKTARIVGGYSAGDWTERWLYHGLHSFDFPWLYNYRPLWDIVVITFMAGGTALCVTSLILAWRILGRKLRGLTGGGRPMPSEDLAVEAD